MLGNLKSKNHLKRKIYNSYSDFLLKDPDKDISINKWDKNDFLLENMYDQFKQKGVDEIYCISIFDINIMKIIF